MGYDMRWVDELSDEEKEARDAARGRFHAAVEERNRQFKVNGRPRTDAELEAHPAQKLVHSTLREFEHLDGYFRLNISGMGAVREPMLAAGAIHTKMEPYPHGEGWPDPADFGLTEWPDSDDPREEAKKFLAAVDDKLAEGVEFPGIPLHKLCSNDGWIVTMPECLSAAKAWADHRQEVVDAGHEWISLTDEFVAWIATAAHRGGFRVY